MAPSMMGRERRPVNRLVASEEPDLPQLAKKPVVAGAKREFIDPEESFDGPRRRKLPNGAWEKLPPRLVVVLSHVMSPWLGWCYVMSCQLGLFASTQIAD